MLKIGLKGAKVSELQKFLSLLGYDLIIDGDFGRATDEAVKDFQLKNSLLVDGIVGDKTFALIKSKQPAPTQKPKEIIAVDYKDLKIYTDYQLPDVQYIKQITPKSQIFLHFTAGGASAKNTVNFWASDDIKVSTAYVIDGNNGNVYQAFHPDYWSYHLGIKGTNGKLDKASIGIEICSYGPLVKRGESYFAWPNDYKTPVLKENVIELETPFRGFNYFYKFSDAQIDSVNKLLLFLIDKYKIKVQDNFDSSFLEYNQDVIDKCLPGIWSHSTVRKDKSDIYPDERVFNILNNLKK